MLTDRTGPCFRNRPHWLRSSRIVLGPAQSIDELHLLYGVTGNFQEARAREDDGETTRAADSDIEPVAAIEKFDIPWHVIARRRGHGDQHHGGFLPLQLVNGTNARVGVKNIPQMVDLHIVGRDDQNVLVTNRSLRALAVDPGFTEQRLVGLLKALGFRWAALREAGMVYRDEAQPRWRYGLIRARADIDTLLMRGRIG